MIANDSEIGYEESEESDSSESQIAIDEQDDEPRINISDDAPGPSVSPPIYTGLTESRTDEFDLVPSENDVKESNREQQTDQ